MALTVILILGKFETLILEEGLNVNDNVCLAGGFQRLVGVV